MKNSRKSWLGGLSAAAVALTMVGAGAGAALAAPGAGNIDPNEDVSLTIEKHDGNKAPLDGATFQVCEVMYGSPAGVVDLTDPAMWELIQDLDPASLSETAAPGEFSVSTNCETGTTGEEDPGSGKWVVPNVTHRGLWLFHETAAPEGYTTDTTKYITTVPRPGTDEWIYDVTVQPKNILDDLEKTAAAEDGFGIGDKITWTVSNTITTVAGKPMTKWGLRDTLPDTLGAFEHISVTLDGELLTACAEDETTDCDYTVTAGSPNKMDLTTERLNSMNENPGEYALAWKYTTTVQGDLTSNGAYVNDVVIDRTVDGEDCGDECPGTSGKANYGDIKIKKVDNEAGNGLKGAKFQVFETSDAAAACIVKVKESKGAHTVKCDGAVEIPTGTFDFESVQSTGIAHIPGLWVGDGTTTSKDYFVVETVAPAGYVNAHIGDQDAWTVTVNAGQTADVDTEIANAQQPPTTLPNTGAVVSGILVIAAIALGGGCIFMIASSRRKANQA